MGYNFFTINDKIYPSQLKEIYNPPKKLYYKGNLDLLKNDKLIAVVGTRNITPYGKISCEKIVKELVESKVTIVSGLALGSDSIAHKVALDNLGNTIAVLGNGIDVVYPSSNFNLWKQIAEKGLILTEFEPKVKPYKSNFPLRNRIIAGLSKGIVLIESKEKGGSLITANLALESNRDVFAVPGDIFSEHSRGCNKLIRDSQAKLILSGEDILEEYSWEKSVHQEPVRNINNIQKFILENLSVEKTLDELIMGTNLKIEDILADIVELEIYGKLKSISGGKYKKISD